MDRLESYLYGIGQLHCKYAHRGFKPEYWDDFKVWRKVAHYIISHMVTGFFDGLKSINNHPPLT
ncbi:unnamed protein product [Angiostrongylus costaricensis]|uniref:GLOBIN domain-containing protein n=1 Tax=Angiostrongylus costaricensis TaxID=334426 RepID=A0A0R3PHN6_ANGCS|nr:unnamed protein product [Angiostrongylus costaricensis]